jgi:hypothetical protein
MYTTYHLSSAQEVSTDILDRFKAIKAFKDEDKEKIYFTIDALIHEITNRKRYASK